MPFPRLQILHSPNFNSKNVLYVDVHETMTQLVLHNIARVHAILILIKLQHLAKMDFFLQ